MIDTKFRIVVTSGGEGGQIQEEGTWEESTLLCFLRLGGRYVIFHVLFFCMAQLFHKL